MKLSGWKVGIAAVLLLVANRNASGQNWPLPADAPKTDVPCETVSCAASNQTGKKTIGYPESLKFVGRWLDSSSTAIRQYPFRTARSRMVRVVTMKNGQRRIYAIVGSALAAYNAESFFTRVTSRESLMPTTSIHTGNIGAISGTPEVFLRWDRWFYAEGIGGWVTEAGDGYERLMNFDVDDRGYVYLAYDGFSWGIVHDDGGTGGGLMPNIYQQYPLVASADLNSADIAISLTVGDRYYVAVSGKEGKTVLYDVSGLAAGQKPQRLTRSDQGIGSWAKSADGNTLAIVDGGGSLLIYATADYVAGRSPLKRVAPSSPQNPYASVVTDGKRFFSGTLDSRSKAVVVTLSPDNGYEYSERNLGWTLYGTPTVEYSDGYFAVSGADPAFRYGTNVRIYRASSYDEIPLDGYIAKYYTSGGVATLGPQYAYPPSGLPTGIQVYRSSGAAAKTYLLLSMYALGDVYELRAGGSVSARLFATANSPNQFSKSMDTSGPFYGNELTFKSEVSSDVSTVRWDFGETPVPTVKMASGGDTIKHQYGGLTDQQLPATFRVSAASPSDSAISAGLDVTLQRPAIAVRIKDKPSLLFLQPNASAPAQIVVGDYWADASDGAVESHVAEWAFSDLPSERRLPDVPVSVGGCTPYRTLTLTTRYGAYQASTLDPKGTTIAYKLDGIAYSVRPYAVGVSGPVLGTGADVGRLIFAANSTPSAALSSGGDTAVSYKWDVTDFAGTTVIMPGDWQAATLSTIAAFKPLQTAFAGASDWRVRLSVNATGAVSVACATLRDQVASSGPLTGPDPRVPVANGCGTVGAPCSISVGSMSNRDMTSWQYAWTSVGPAAVTPGSSAEYKPVFSQPGKYTVSVTVKNAIGIALPQSFDLTVGASVCSSAPNELNSGVAFRGTAANSTCAGRGSTCTAGEVIQFSVSTLGWSLASCDTFEWNFGDSTTANEATPTHTYSGNGTYTVTLKLIGGLSTVTISTTVTIGTKPPDPNPTCGSMIAGTNVDFGYYGSSGCSPNGPACKPNETLAFTVYGYVGYTLSCGPHSFQWNFGDNSGTSTAQNPTYSYATGGARTISLTMTNPTGQSVTMQRPVTVESTGGNTNDCPAMSMFNVGVTAVGAKSGNCATGKCESGEDVSFGLDGSYPLACGTHQYDWDLGGGTKSTEAKPTRRYTAAGTYTVRLKLSNGKQVIDLERTVVITAINPCPEMSVFNLGITAIGAKSGNCATGKCEEGEVVTLSIDGGYPLACSTHTFQWDFGDGAKSADARPTHTYTAPLAFTVKLKLSNGKQIIDLERALPIIGKAPAIGSTNRRRSSGRR